MAAVALLRRVWLQNDWGDGTPLRWRDAANMPPAAHGLSSPDDLDAHDARKATTQWVGDKVHLTETCEDEAPHRITHVEPRSGPTADGAATPKIHAALQPRDFLPGVHIVDTGFLAADLLVKSRDDEGVDLLGPTRLDSHGPAQEGAGVDAQHFQIDGGRPQASCPAGQARLSWAPRRDPRGTPVLQGRCSTKDGRRCDHVAPCLRSTTRDPRRTITIRPQPPYQALQAARPREATDAFRADYARRAGLEGTLARGTRAAR